MPQRPRRCNNVFETYLSISAVLPLPKTAGRLRLASLGPPLSNLVERRLVGKLAVVVLPPLAQHFPRAFQLLFTIANSCNQPMVHVLKAGRHLGFGRHAEPPTLLTCRVLGANRHAGETQLI